MSGLFGTDGVRGIAGQWPLTAEFVEQLGRAAGRVLGTRPGSKFLVVRDTRASGSVLLKALAAGLAAEGLHVLDGGVLPTPVVSVLAPRLGLAGGSVISASHNPAEFNGVKFFGPEGMKLTAAQEVAIEEGAQAGVDRTRRSGKITAFPLARALYEKFLIETLPSPRPLSGLSLVIDCAHGATSGVAPALLRRLGARVIVTAASPDGKNINRGCGAVHPEVLAPWVKKAKAHAGVSFDGDGDRAIFVDEEGVVRDGDAVVMLAARRWASLGKLKNNRVAVTVMSNYGTFKALEALGVSVEVTPVGDKHVWDGMVRSGAVIGGEPSGHVIFRDFLSTGDGLLTALQVFSIMASTGQSLSALTALAAPFPQVLVNVPVKEKTPLEKIPGYTVAAADIERRLTGHGRLLVRYSGTEPLLRIMLEGPHQASIQKDAHQLAQIVRNSL